MPKRDAHPRRDEADRLTHTQGSPILLHSVVFVCGAVLMALEIVGSRVLAPYFGNSIFVWGSLISVVLAALSLGYWLGGLLADRQPRYGVLAFLIAVPGVIIALLPFVYPALNRTLAASALGARSGPLIACLILFLVPSIFLGTVSPFAVRLQARAVASVGTTAGALYAVSTAGSILGTLLTAFYMIATLGVANIVHGLGITLLAVAGAISVTRKHFGRAVVTGLCAVLLLSFVIYSAKTQTAEAGLLLERDSFYNHITLAEDSTQRYMDFENLRQSAMLLSDPYELRLRYTRFLTLALTFVPEPKRVLILGLGGGSFPKRLYKDFPGLTIDVVDIDPAVVAIATQYFQVPNDDRLRIHIQDGRRFLRETSAQYDLIFLDAYNSDTIPFHLTTREFFQDVQRHLTPGGVMVSNIIGALRGNESRFFRAMYRTIAETFPTVYAVPTYNPSDGVVFGEINIILFATGDRSRISRGEFVARAGRVGGRMIPASELAGYAAHLLEIPIDVQDVPTLTDDFAPVEILRAAS